MVADYHDVPKRPKPGNDSKIRKIFNDLSEEQPNVYRCERWTRMAMIFKAIEIYVDFRINAKSRK